VPRSDQIDEFIINKRRFSRPKFLRRRLQHFQSWKSAARSLIDGRADAHEIGMKYGWKLVLTGFEKSQIPALKES